MQELERLYEKAMKDVDIQVKVKQDKLDDKIAEVRDFLAEIDQTVDMLKLRIKNQSQL